MRAMRVTNVQLSVANVTSAEHMFKRQVTFSRELKRPDPFAKSGPQPQPIKTKGLNPQSLTPKLAKGWGAAGGGGDTPRLAG
jgi:hypothetical protein